MVISSIYTKFNALLFGGAFVSAVAVASVTIMLSNQFVEQALTNKMVDAQRAFESEIFASQRTAEMMSVLVSEMPLVDKALAEEDRAALETEFTAGFKQMNQLYDIQQLHFHTPPATSFFRVHKPDTFGGDMSSYRPTIVEAFTKQVAVSGLEEGATGISIRGVAPISDNGTRLGTVEFGLTLQAKFVEKFTERNDLQTAIYTAGEKGFDLIGSTFKKDLDPVPYDLKAHMDKTGMWQTLPDGNPQFAGMAFPVRNFSGKSIGVAIIAIDRTRYNSITASGYWAAGGIFALMLAIAAGTSLAARGMIFRPISKITTNMNVLAKGNLEAQSDYADRKDEVGNMAQAVEVFRQNAVSIAQHERGRNGTDPTDARGARRDDAAVAGRFWRCRVRRRRGRLLAQSRSRIPGCRAECLGAVRERLGRDG